MKMKKMTAIATAFILFLGLSLSSCGEGGDEVGYATWDENGDEMLDDNEYDNVYNETAYYDEWDVNNDDNIDENEWGTGISTYWGDYEAAEYGAFEDWDADTDGYISTGEFSEGVYGFYDLDADGVWNEEEYNAWYGGFNE